MSLTLAGLPTMVRPRRDASGIGTPLFLIPSEI